MMSMFIVSIISHLDIILGNPVISVKFVFSFWHIPVYIPWLSSDDLCL